MRSAAARIALVVALAAVLSPPAARAQTTPTSETVFAFGDAVFRGSTGTAALARPVIDIEPTRDGGGYWLAARDGGIFAFGNAPFLGSTGAITLNQPMVGMAATPSSQGYWLVAGDGGVFAFGDARFLGSTGAITLNQAMVGMARTPSGQGYWLVANDGGVFAFGDARFLGSTGAITLNQPIVGMAATPSGQGYWLVASDGGVFAFGDARFLGSTGAITLNKPIVGMATTPSGQGYWLAASDGGIFAFGDARFLGSTGANPPDDAVVGIAATPSGGGYWLATTGPGFFEGFWPVSTPPAARTLQQRVDGGQETWRRDPAAVARAFAQDFIGWRISVTSTSVTGSAAQGWAGRVELRPFIGEPGAQRPGARHVLSLVGLKGAQSPAWFVTALTSDHVSVRVPIQASFVASPLRVAGVGVGFEANLPTRIRDDNGRVLHPRPGQFEGFVMGGSTSPEPFEGRLVFSRPSAPAGTLMVSSDTGLEGPPPAAAIVRLRF